MMVESSEPIVRPAASAAWETLRQQRASQARVQLGQVLDGLDVTELEQVHLEVTESWTLAVFADDDVHLAVRQRDGGWEARLVTVDPAGGWREGVRLRDLAHLGSMLLADRAAGSEVAS